MHAGTTWYWNLRCKLIKKGVLTKYHSPDICRNPVKNGEDPVQKAALEKQQAAAAEMQAANDID